MLSRILSGEFSDRPESAFYLIGAIDEAEEAYTARGEHNEQ